jgi:hypothetical protein
MNKAARFCPKTAASVPGSLQVTWVRCGKPGCRCSRGKLHGPYTRHVWREEGRTYRRYVPLGDVQVTRTATERWRREHPSMRMLLRDVRALWREIEALRGMQPWPGRAVSRECQKSP